jgi:hypothetical protein
VAGAIIVVIGLAICFWIAQPLYVASIARRKGFTKDERGWWQTLTLAWMFLWGGGAGFLFLAFGVAAKDWRESLAFLAAGAALAFLPTIVVLIVRDQFEVRDDEARELRELRQEYLARRRGRRIR